MSRLRGAGLRAQLAAALAAVAVVSVALTTALASSGLEARLRDAADDRLAESARHSAELSAEIYARDRGWSRRGVTELGHLARMNGYRLRVRDGADRALGTVRLAGEHASAQVRVAGATVGTVDVAPIGGSALTAEDRRLHHRLNRLHLLAGLLALGLAGGAAVLVAPVLARPLRRLTEVARRMEHGALDARAGSGGGREIEQVGHALNRLAETLERAETMRREAAADIAHELRTPLGGIVARIEAAQDGVLADEGANLDAIHTEAMRLTRLVEDLGRLADAQQPGLLLDRQRIDLAAIARRRAAHQADFFAARDVALEQDLTPSIMEGDGARLEQIVDNLLANALRYTDPGGHVMLRVHPAGEDVELEVTDTGIGIRPEDLPHIFERFWRSEKSRSRATGGAGIGLAIVRELVDAHDGLIDVESTFGVGSSFRVSLPVGQPRNASAGQAATSARIR